jgi:ParB-like chromosome segregation protein Spo0J
MELKINTELENLVPKMNEEEFNELKESILKDGQQEPIEVMSDGTIIDGHNRYKACQIVGVEPKYTIIDIDTIEEAKHRSYLNNINRRNLNTYQKVEWKLSVLPENSSLREKSKTGDITLSTVVYVSKIMKDATEETKQKLRAGELNIKPVYFALKLHDEVLEKLKYKRQDIQDKIKEKYGEVLANPEAMSKSTADKIQHDVDEITGVTGNTYLKDFFYPEDEFTEEEAEEFAKLRDGRVIGKVTVTNWQIRCDFIKEKELRKK